MFIKEKEEREREMQCVIIGVNRKGWKYFSRKVYPFLTVQVTKKYIIIIIIVIQREMREADYCV